MTQKDKLRESFLALVSIKSTANNIIDYCSEYSSEAANYAQEIKHKCEEVLKLLKYWEIIGKDLFTIWLKRYVMLI